MWKISCWCPNKKLTYFFLHGPRKRQERFEAPYFLKTIGDCEIYEGMTAKFTACVGGTPEPEFEWFKDGSRLYPSERIRMEREGVGLYRLLLRTVTEGDVGRYSLRVFNPHGEAKCSAPLVFDCKYL